MIKTEPGTGSQEPGIKTKEKNNGELTVDTDDPKL
jgi:hypothetical protein